MNAFEEFKKSLELFLTTWKSLEIRALGDKESERLISFVACLTSDTRHPLEFDEPIPGMVFIRDALRVPGGANGVLTEPSEGAISLASQRWSMSGFPTEARPYDI